ncbi:phage major capsid protein [bacterium]|nr:phage major capsid protein [bacterium]
MQLFELYDEREKLVKAQTEFWDAWNGEPITGEMKQKEGKMEQRFDELTLAIERQKRLEIRNAEEERLNRPVNRINPPYPNSRGTANAGTGAVIGRDASNGQEVRAYDNSVKLAGLSTFEYPGGIRNDEVTLGAIARGAGTANWSDVLPEVRTMTTASGSGSYLIPAPLSLNLIDAARAKARVFQAGAQAIPMENGTLKIARLDSDPTAFHRAESAAITASDPTFTQASLEAKTMGILVKLPRELWDDSVILENALTDSISTAAANRMDYEALLGDGTGSTPTGIASTGSILTAALGTTPTYATFRTAMAALLDANADPDKLSAIYNSSVWAIYDGLQDGAQNPQAAPYSWQRAKHFVSNQIPSTLGTGAQTDIFLGQFDHLGIGIRTNLELRAFEAGSDASTDAVANFEIWLRAIVRYDIVLLRPGLFYCQTGVDLS